MMKKEVQTPEERRRSLQERIAEQERITAEQERITEEIRLLSSNWLCRVCHKASMTQVLCRRYGGSICMKHCKECEYHQPMFWHCLYRAQGGDKE